MACCGRGAAPKSPPTYPAPMPRVIRPPQPKPVVTQAPPGSFNPPGRFCSKCGWIVAVSKYADPTTGNIVEKRSCTNRKCPDYHQP